MHETTALLLPVQSMSGRTTKRAGVDKEKAWASGRVLTPEQRARKQDADRKANRFLKKEVQDRLALLEERVLQLESEPTNSSGALGLGVNVSQGIPPGVGTLPTSTNTTSHGSLTTSPDKVLQWDGMSFLSRYSMGSSLISDRYIGWQWSIRLLAAWDVPVTSNRGFGRSVSAKQCHSPCTLYSRILSRS